MKINVHLFKLLTFDKNASLKTSQKTSERTLLHGNPFLTLAVNMLKMEIQNTVALDLFHVSCLRIASELVLICETQIF